MSRVTPILKNLLTLNPIIVKEIRSRMRGPRAFITLTLILLLMGLVMYGVLQLILASSRMGSNILSPQVGQGLFAALAFMELFMICAITPAVTAGAISGEKEKQTYEMLMATPLSPTQILWGKLISALSYVFLLLFAGIPLASVVFIFGGVTISDMVRALLVLIGVAVAFGILGMFMSALFGRTGRATVASFLTVVFLMVGPIFIAGLVGVLRNGEPPRWILAPSPISALSAALAAGIGSNNGAGSIFYALSGIFNMGVQTVSQTGIPRPLYHYTIPFYVLVSLILYLLSTRLVQPTRRWKLRPREWVVGITSLVIIGGVILGGFYATARRYEWAAPISGQFDQTKPVQAFPVAPVPAQKEVIVAQPVETATMPPTPTPAAPPGTANPDNPQGYPPAPLGPTPTPLAAGDPGSSLADETQAEIYAAVARQFFTVDNTFGDKSPGWTGLYLASTTSNETGSPAGKNDHPVKFSKAILSGVATRLNDLPAKIMWIESLKAAPIDSRTGAVDNGKSAVITFGNIFPQADGTVQVGASLYFGSTGGAGKTYILSKVDGAWKITGTTGVEWIS